MKIKICGIIQRDEIERLDELNVDYGGVWSGIPKGRYNRAECKAKELLGMKTAKLKLVLVTLENKFDRIDSIIANTRAHAIQLHGFQLPGLIKQIKKAYKDELKVMKVLHVKGEVCLEDNIIDRYVEAGVDYFILDTFMSNRAIGSTGKTLPLHALDKIITKIHSKKAFIAGGVDKDNISVIFKQIAPFGVDIDSSARKDNKLDYHKIDQILHCRMTEVCKVCKTDRVQLPLNNM